MAQEKKGGSASSAVLWLMLGGGALVFLYYGSKSLQRLQSGLLPGLSGFPMFPGSSTAAITNPNQISTSQTAPPINTLIQRLTSNQMSRYIFLFQAGMYSYYQTEALPDGMNGPVTQSLVDKVNLAANPTGPSVAFSALTLRSLYAALQSLTGETNLTQADVRVLPDSISLPASLVNRINADGRAVAPDVPLLQIIPS